MSFLDGILGGVVGGEMTNLVSGFIQQHGGVPGIVAQLEKQGLGATAKSWVGSGENQPITAEQVHSAFGADAIAGMAAKFGLNPQEVTQKLSQLLPQVVDQLTPNGAVKPA